MASLRINDIDLYYEIHGKGEPLILVAGLASDSQSWLPVIENLSRKFQLIVFDNRGVGRTKPMDAFISISKMADDCVSLIHHLGLTKVKLLGHSMGGMIALDCAIRYPDLITDLVLVASSSANSNRNKIMFQDWITYLENEMPKDLWFRNLFYWIFSKHFFNDKEFLENTVQMSINYPFPQTNKAFVNQISAINAFDCTANLKEIKTNTLVISGEEDILFSTDESYNALNSISGVKFAFIEDAAHSVHMEKPNEFINIVKDFLLNI